MKGHGQAKEERDQAKLKKVSTLAGDRSSGRVRVVVRQYGKSAWQGWLDSSETLPVRKRTLLSEGRIQHHPEEEAGMSAVSPGGLLFTGQCQWANSATVRCKTVSYPVSHFTE